MSGVPQGSILGPTSVLVSISDLTECSLSRKFGYADDTKFNSDNTPIAYLDVRKIWKSCEKNFMEIKMTKSNLLPLKVNGELRLFNYVFESTDCVKDLGLISQDC